MEKKVLAAIKKSPKFINSSSITFKKLKRNTLPPPFKRMGGSRAHTSGVLSVADDLRVLFIWRDGEILTDTSFYGYLLRKDGDELLSLFEFHWHPSHKGYHCILPCGVVGHAPNRLIPKSAPELDLIHKQNLSPNLDPRIEEDRLNLINFFCEKVKLLPVSTNVLEANQLPLQ